MNVWLPAIRAHSGADVFTARLADALNRTGIRAEITWLPLRAEYAPWSVEIPRPPAWADLAHVNSWLPDRFIPQDLPVVATIHLVVHDPALAPYKSWAQDFYHRRWIKRLETNVLSRAQAVTAVSAYTGNQVQSTFGCKNVITIPNWIDTDIFRPQPRRSPRRPFRLLYIGNWSRRKGVDLLPGIMQRLGPDFKLHFATGARRQKIARNLPENMMDLGALHATEDVIHAYQDADALLFPSRLEGFSLAALEAQACGVPVIAANTSSLPELVIDGVTGSLCKPDDTAAFCGAVQTLASNRKLWRDMSKAARDRATQYFAEPVAMSKYIECYRRVLAYYV